MRKVVDSRLPELASMAALVGTLLLIAFLWVWIGQWSRSASAYPDTGEWWREFALPRAAWSLLVGVPLGALVAVLVRQALRRSSSWRDSEEIDRS
jgi:ABC-type Fe3+ transport system permease subunit